MENRHETAVVSLEPKMKRKNYLHGSCRVTRNIQITKIRVNRCVIDHCDLRQFCLTISF